MSVDIPSELVPFVDSVIERVNDAHQRGRISRECEVGIKRLW